MNDREWINRVRDELAPEFSDVIDHLMRVYFGKICESPIESGLCLSIAMMSRMVGEIPGIFYICKHPRTVDELQRYHRSFGIDPHLLIPQYKWRNYRIDIALCLGAGLIDKWIFIECDGHDFHERTKEQAANDRSRDREIQMAGIPILRFTGSEIYASPTCCARDVLSLANSLYTEKYHAAGEAMNGAHQDH